MAKEDIVVVAVDGSEASKNAVRWAANTALKRGIPLRIASSYTMPQFLYAEGMVPQRSSLRICRLKPSRRLKRVARLRTRLLQS